MPKDANNIKLSILILSIPSRFDIVRGIIEKLTEQTLDRDDVEILSLMDNKSLNVSDKRNALLNIARGSHITWLDDDDDVAHNYVERLTETIEKNPTADVISFNQQCYLDGKKAKVFAKMGNPHEHVTLDETGTEYKDTLRPPYHWCCWKTSLAQSEKFRFGVFSPNSHVGEDIDWLQRLYPKVKKSVYLENDTLHIYRYTTELSESRL